MMPRRGCCGGNCHIPLSAKGGLLDKLDALTPKKPSAEEPKKEPTEKKEQKEADTTCEG